jgi:hypothetical protein
MAINFYTIPTQDGKLGYFFPKLTAQIMFTKIQIIYMYICVCVFVCIYIYIYIYIRGPIIAVCYALIAATAFPGSAVI